jgi:hypothetical protein
MKCMILNIIIYRHQNFVIRPGVFAGRRFHTDFRNEAEDQVMVVRALADGRRFAYFDDVHVIYHVDSVRRKLECDLDYLRRLSPWLDFRILLGTCLSVVGIPFAVTRAVLRIPDAPSAPNGPAVTEAGPAVTEAGPVVAPEAVAVPQVQSV